METDRTDASNTDSIQQRMDVSNFLLLPRMRSAQKDQSKNWQKSNRKPSGRQKRRPQNVYKTWISTWTPQRDRNYMEHYSNGNMWYDYSQDIVIRMNITLIQDHTASSPFIIQRLSFTRTAVHIRDNLVIFNISFKHLKPSDTCQFYSSSRSTESIIVIDANPRSRQSSSSTLSYRPQLFKTNARWSQIYWLQSRR